MEEHANEPLARFTTLRIGGEAQRLFQPKTVDELIAVTSKLQESDEPWYILGGGSNLLVSSAGVKGTVIRTAQMLDTKRLDTNLIEAAAGVRLPHLAKYVAPFSLSGLEFSVGIPGTVGGAVVMNAGAHGSCMAEIIESVLVYDVKENKLITLTRKDLSFTYRRSSIDLKTQVVISARFKLLPGKQNEIEAKIKANEEYRLKTQPIGFPNAGSTFINPEPTRSAGFLVEQAGLKGTSVGDASVSELHANFVINLGHANSHDTTTLLRRMQEGVYNKFSVEMRPEWKTMGEFTADELTPWKIYAHKS